jgi:hypothetical protein
MTKERNPDRMDNRWKTTTGEREERFKYTKGMLEGKSEMIIPT